jgi:hypothetical protein
MTTKQSKDGVDITVTLIDEPTVNAGWTTLWQRLLQPLETETTEEEGDDDAE